MGVFFATVVFAAALLGAAVFLPGPLDFFLTAFFFDGVFTFASAGWSGDYRPRR
jgi:hypothetical protein